MLLNQTFIAEYRALPISNVAVNKNTVTFVNASGRQRVTLDSTSERNQFIKWLLS
jgi:hypothetical protein